MQYIQKHPLSAVKQKKQACVLQSEQSLLFDAMKTELLEKIRRLEEDRQNMDLTSGTLKPPQIVVNISIVG